MPVVLTTMVERASQIELGAFYLIKGHDSAGFPLPPQVFQPARFVTSGGLGLLCLEGELWVASHGHRFREVNHVIPLIDVGIPPSGVHDVHLERVPDAAVAAAVGQTGREQADMSLDRKKARRRSIWEETLKDRGVL